MRFLCRPNTYRQQFTQLLCGRKFISILNLSRFDRQPKLRLLQHIFVRIVHRKIEHQIVYFWFVVEQCSCKSKKFTFKWPLTHWKIQNSKQTNFAIARDTHDATLNSKIKIWAKNQIEHFPFTSDYKASLLHEINDLRVTSKWGKIYIFTHHTCFDAKTKTCTLQRLKRFSKLCFARWQKRKWEKLKINPNFHWAIVSRPAATVSITKIGMRKTARLRRSYLFALLFDWITLRSYYRMLPTLQCIVHTVARNWALEAF